MKKKKRQPSFSAKSPRPKKNQPPTKPRNTDVRTREYLTAAEVKDLRTAAKTNSRNGTRDYWLITMIYRHGLRVAEAADLKWDQVDFRHARLHVNRLKNGDPAVHPIEGDELRALRKLKDAQDSDFVFTSERGTPLSPRTIHAIVARAGVLAGLKFPCHPHMLRHARGFKLADKGIDTRAIQGYLGHKNIQHTVLYTKLSPTRFKGFASD